MEETSLIGAGAGDIHHDKLAQQPADPSPGHPLRFLVIVLALALVCRAHSRAAAALCLPTFSDFSPVSPIP